MNPHLSFKALGQAPPPPEKIAAWMEQHGWQASDEDNGALFTGPQADDGEVITRWLPPKSASDYPIRVEDLLCTVSSIEERSPMAILQEMQLGLAQKIPPLSDILWNNGLPLEEQLVDAISKSLDVGPGTREVVENLVIELSRIIPGAILVGRENFEETSELAFKEAALVCSRVAQTPAVHRSLAAFCQIMLFLDTPLTWSELASLWRAASTDDVQEPQKTCECLHHIYRARKQSKPLVVPQN